MANRCPNCGKFLSAKDEVCSNCGTVLKGAPKAEPKKEVKPVKVEKTVVVDEEDVSVDVAPSVIRSDSEPIVITQYRNVKVNIPADFSGPSYFDGKLHQYIGWWLLGFIVTLFTLGICYPLAYGWLAKWEARHTVTCGYRQVFDGKAGSLIPKWLLWCLFSILTLFIFALWNPIRFRRWKVARIKLVKDPRAK